jgi:hypothetical protein
MSLDQAKSWTKSYLSAAAAKKPGASARRKTLTLELPEEMTSELPEEMYEAVKEAAEATGKPPAEWMTMNLPQLLPSREVLETRLALARAKEEAIAQMAARTGKAKAEVAAEWRAKYGPKPPPQLTEEERKAAWEQLRRHMGAVSSGDPRSADSDRIDADLAREYGSTHEFAQAGFQPLLR